MVTASHNPAKYNGYKVYGSDGCQMTERRRRRRPHRDQQPRRAHRREDDEVRGGARLRASSPISPRRSPTALSTTSLPSRSIRASAQKRASSWSIPPSTARATSRCAACSPRSARADVTVVPEQEHPDGNFPTCPFPNPEIKEALAKGLELARETGADLHARHRPRLRPGGHRGEGGRRTTRLLTGNQVGALLFDYICQLPHRERHDAQGPRRGDDDRLHQAHPDDRQGLRRRGAQRADRLQVHRRADRAA